MCPTLAQPFPTVYTYGNFLCFIANRALMTRRRMPRQLLNLTVYVLVDMLVAVTQRVNRATLVTLSLPNPSRNGQLLVNHA
jgi:hypothetical protein